MAFCTKCGTKLNEGVKFCTGCGNAVGGVSNTPVTPAPLQQSQPSAVQAGVFQNQNAPVSQVKESKKPLIIGLVACAILLIVAIAVNWEGGANNNIDYIATVNKHRPFVSQGYNTEYGMVFGKYIDSIKYAERKNGNVVYIDISGKLKGTGGMTDIVVTISVTHDDVKSNNVKITPYSVTIGYIVSTQNQNEAVKALLIMFSAYDEGLENLSRFLSYWLDD
jgi:hypothetical protein